MFRKNIHMRLLCAAGTVIILLAGPWMTARVSAGNAETDTPDGGTGAESREAEDSLRSTEEGSREDPEEASLQSREEAGRGEASWLDPLEATAALRITDFPVRTEFYAAGIAESTLRELGIDGSDVPPGKLADAADRLSRSMTERQKELIRADGMTIRGLAFGRMYLITGHAVQTEEGRVTPLPFLVRPSKEQSLIRVEAKYTVEKLPASASEPVNSEKKKAAADSSGTQYETDGTGRKKGAVSVTLKKKYGDVSLEPVQTGDIDLKELAVTILSAFILGLAVIIRKRIK